MEKVNTGFITGSNQGDDRRYYEKAGAGETLVFIHAGFVDRGMWDAQFEAFAQTHRVVRYDQLGFGKSEKATGPVSRSAELGRILEELDIQRAALIACSQGGTAALDFALEHPDKVTALVLVSADPSGFEMQGEMPADLQEMFGALQNGDLERVSELQIKLWVDGGSRKPEDVNPDMRKQAAAMNKIAVENNTFATADSQPVDPLDPPAVKRLGEVKIPVLIINGALDHPELLRAGDEMAAGISGARKIVLPDAAHVPNMDQPELFIKEVAAFLKENGV